MTKKYQVISDGSVIGTIEHNVLIAVLGSVGEDALAAGITIKSISGEGEEKTGDSETSAADKPEIAAGTSVDDLTKMVTNQSEGENALQPSQIVTTLPAEELTARLVTLEARFNNLNMAIADAKF